MSVRITSDDECPTTDATAFLLRVDPTSAVPPQGYQLQINTEGAAVIAPTIQGLFYGTTTLAQWIEQHRLAVYPQPLTAVGTIWIEDWPDFAARGVLLDISRDKVPTLETLFQLIDLLAGLKVNQLQLYTEHTFAYRGHEIVWCNASPITPEEAHALDDYCHERFIELVPNQNSFGHFHRWLIHEPYRQLAECPDGIPHPFSDRSEPFGLCPTDPGSLTLLRDLYAQLLPNFSSTMFNVGLDETLDLGQCRSRDICARDGRETVYLRFLQQVHALVCEHGRRMQFWDDIVIACPELLASLPSDVIALEWGYEANHPFEERLELIARAGIPAYVCPGTSSWNSFGGRAANALQNIRRAGQSGLCYGAIGYLNTDWGDNGHLQPLSVSYFGLLAGAACSWNVSATPDLAQMPNLLARHAFDDLTSELGHAAVELASAYELTGATPKNGSVLFRLLISHADALTHPRYRGLTRSRLEHTDAHIQYALERLERVHSEHMDQALLLRELRWVGHTLRFACAMGCARLDAGAEHRVDQLPTRSRQMLAQRLVPLIAEHQPIWLARHRAGGRKDSLYRLEQLLERLR